MRIVICEDEHYWRDALESAISKWAAARNIIIECHCTSSPTELMAYLKEQTDIDVLFLDISLGARDIDGMALAKIIRKSGNSMPLIFVTIDTLRAADGYIVEAMGFLSKPIEEARLSLFLDRIIKRQRGPKNIKVLVDGRMTIIPEKQIIYAEIVDHTAIYHTMQGDFKLRSTLSEVLAALSVDCFVQIHRAYVIALDKVLSVKTTHPYSVDLHCIDGGTNLPVSRKYISKLMEVYSDEVLEKMI